MFGFADNTVIIPVGIVEEIDRFKKEMSNRGYNARAVARLLDSLRGDQSFTGGVSLPNGGTLKVYCDADRAMAVQPENGDVEILRVAQAIQQNEPEIPSVIVTKDINLRIRANVCGLRAEDYESDHVVLADLDRGEVELPLEDDMFDAFTRCGEVPVSGGLRNPGEYVLLRAAGNHKRSKLARVDQSGDRLVALQAPQDGVCGIRPRNKEQYFAVDALLCPEIGLATLMGKAGTGKTLLAMAAAMYATLVQKAYRGVLVVRPIVPLGRDLGYLPGELERKLEPWMKPIADTVDFILTTGGPIGGHPDTDSLLRSGCIEIQPLAYIRGRNISNQFVVIDEAQNLTPLEMKTVITRIGQGAKVAITGDPYQIDNPYVDANSNGFSYLVNHFQAQPLAAHVALHKGERSGQAVARVSDIKGEIDAATVAVPTVYHAEVAIPLMERGVAVLVEKPLAPDTTSGKQLLDASRKHNCFLQVGHSERFNPVVQAMLRMGVTPRFIETHRISPFTFRSADIGVVFDMMIHDIDIVLHLVKQREYTIDAVGVSVLGICEDVANARIRFANQTVVNLTASRLALKTERKIRIFCPTAYLSMDYQKKTGIAIKLKDNADLIRMARERNFEDLAQMQNLDFSSMMKIEPLLVDDVEPLRAEIESFLDSIRHGTEAAVSAEEGYAAVEMAEKITNSVREQDWGRGLAETVGS